MLKASTRVEFRIDINNQHSERVTQHIRELLQLGSIGTQVALLIDYIDAPTVLFKGKEKPELFHDLHTLVAKILIENVGTLTPTKAERMNVLLHTLEQYIECISLSLFLNETMQMHVGILKHQIELYKQRNFKVLRPQNSIEKRRKRLRF